MIATVEPCKVCGAAAGFVGSKLGKFKVQDFHFYHCESCRFTFVGNPWTDYAAVYNEGYYRGQGPDPWIDYVFELEEPKRTVRIYEWRGILEVVRSCVRVTAQTRWLDFGCGNGGLVRYLKDQNCCEAVGFEEGWIAGQARERGIPVFNDSELMAWDGTCDVVTAIEVIEHVERPVEVLGRIRRLLKPGGFLFLTTGNAGPQRGRVLDWRYATPEMHISFFEPRTLAAAMKMAGFKPEFRGFMPGFSDVIRYKILKNLSQREISTAERLLPWSILSRFADWKYGITAHPVGWSGTTF